LQCGGFKLGQVQNIPVDVPDNVIGDFFARTPAHQKAYPANMKHPPAIGDQIVSFQHGKINEKKKEPSKQPDGRRLKQRGKVQRMGSILKPMR